MVTAIAAASLGLSAKQAVDAKKESKKAKRSAAEEKSRLATEKADEKKKLAASTATASDATSRRIAARLAFLDSFFASSA